MTRVWLNFSFLSPFSSWSTWSPGSSWVSGKCWYLSNSRVVWNDTFTCGKRNSDDHHTRRHCVQEIQSTHCTKAQAHIFPLEPKGVMPAAKFPLEQSIIIKTKYTAISYDSSTRRRSVKVNSWSLNHKGESLQEAKGFEFLRVQILYSQSCLRHVNPLSSHTCRIEMCVSPCKMRSTLQKCNSYSFFAGYLILYSWTLFPLM